MTSKMTLKSRFIYSAVLCSIYSILFVWFRSHDVWNVKSVVSSGEMLIWTLLRAIFVLCLGVSCITVGKLILRFQEKLLKDLSDIEQILLYFFIGSSVLRMAMYFVGLYNLYIPSIAFFATLPLVVLFPFLFDFNKMFIKIMESANKNPLESVVCGLLLLVAVIILGIIYVGHCQYSFDGDYLTHYGPYYETVIRNGGLAPNDLWYQYFYSKCAGLFYLSMLITDRVGPLLVSFLHLFSCAVLVYAIMRRVCNNTLWSISTSIFMLGMMSWPIDGFFIKHHCELGAMIFSTSVVVVLISLKNARRYINLFIVALCILQSSLLLYSVQAGAFTLILIGILFTISLYKRDLAVSVRYSALVAISFLVVLFSMLHNYSLTGLYEATPYRVFLSFWNQKIFSQWVSPYLMLYVSEASSPELGTVGISGTLQNFVMYGKLFRLQKFMFSPTFWAVAIVVISLGLRGTGKFSFFNNFKPDLFGLSLRKHNSATEMASRTRLRLFQFELVAQDLDHVRLSLLIRNIFQTVIISSFAMIAIVFLVYLLIRQPISILRLTEFVSIYVTMFTISILVIFAFFIREPILHRIVNLCVPIVLSLLVLSWSIADGRNNKLKTPLKFAFGMVSANSIAPVDKTVSDQYKVIRTIAGEDGRIVSFNLNIDYGPLLLQYPGLITEISYAFGNRWHEVVFSDPASAKKTLQDLGINYFLVDLKSPFFGLMPSSPLFTGNSLATNFRIVWQLDSRYMLTWSEDHKPMTDEFLADWKDALELCMPSFLKTKPGYYGQELYDRIYYLYELNHHAMYGIVRPKHLEKVVDRYQ